MHKTINKLENKKILILGFGREGQSTYTFLRKYFPDKTLYLRDKSEMAFKDSPLISVMSKDKNLIVAHGNEYLQNISEFDVIFKSPGIPNKLTEIKTAIKNGVILTSQSELFLNMVKGTVIGVTGTKGKSTTSSLIDHILKVSGYKSVLIGNIGNPCLDYLSEDSPETYFVFEFSSHQLSNLKTSPKIAVFLNIFREHLDYYEDFDDYVSAKANITLYQSKEDFFIYNSDFPRISKFSQMTKALKLNFSTTKISSDAFVKDGYVWINNEKLLPLKEAPLTGGHNLNNIEAASLVVSTVGIDTHSISKALQSFHPLEGRLEEVGSIGDVLFINDTLSTIPESAIAAMESFSDSTIIPIIGGYDRDIDFSRLVSYLAKSENIHSIVLIGTVSGQIERLLSQSKYKGKVFNFGKSASMKEIVDKAYSEVNGEGVVLLSPAAASFDMFASYKERGDLFKEAVEALRKS